MELLAGSPVLPNKTVFSQSMKSSASPQSVYFDKAKNVRAERFEGIVHLYRFDDITRINRHPDIRGTGARGGMRSAGLGSCWAHARCWSVRKRVM